MSEDKLCPFMSRPDGTADVYGNPRVAPVNCQKERCMAWQVKSYDACIDGKEQRVIKSGCRLIP